jgi:putative phosphoribosyl transferase
VASSEAAAAVSAESDRLVCLLTPRDFQAVGPWYDDFAQVDDREVRDLLDPSGL